jgi:hypothetical protein
VNTHTPVKTAFRNDGVQKLYRFGNGYGASVVRSKFSYGGTSGLWEICVVLWDGQMYEPIYDTPITDDVVGWLSDSDVAELLSQIEALPSAT